MIPSQSLLTRICPVCKGIAKRHRRRNYKFQYKCTKCGFFFTEQSKYKIQYAGSQYDEFILEYIRLKVIGEKIKVTKVCNQFDIKRATYYRMIPGLDLLAFISRWFSKEGIISHKRIVGGKLQLFLRDFAIKMLSIQIKIAIKIPNECKLRFESDMPFVWIWEDLSYMTILEDADNAYYINVSIPYEEDQISLILSHFRKLKALS